jgi:AraC-like DNA-binding protein
MQFRRDFLGRGFFDRPEFREVDRLLETVGGALVFRPTPGVVEQIRSIGRLAPPDRTLALVRLLMDLAGGHPARSIAANRTLGRLGQPARRRVDAICAHLQATYSSPVSLAEVASVAHMTPAALSRFFHRAVGRTITDYVTELRVAAACQLLSDSDLPIAEVATRSGYDNLSNFNRRFRTLKGMSTSRYRRAMAGESSHPHPASAP